MSKAQTKLLSLQDVAKDIEAYIKKNGHSLSNQGFKAANLPISRTTFYSLRAGKNMIGAKKLHELYQALGCKIEVHLFVKKL